MKVTLQNNYSYTYPMKKPVFQSASGEFGKAVGDVFQKETISETARNNLIEKLRLAIKEIIKPKNFMGRGFNGTVYQIDKNFAMKINNYAKPSLETSDLVIKKGKNIFIRCPGHLNRIGKEDQHVIRKNIFLCLQKFLKKATTQLQRILHA